MSTASPLPLQPLPPPTVSPGEALALKQQVSNRLLAHRQRRPRAAELQPALPMDGLQNGRDRRVADSVAARFARSVSYRDYLQTEAEAAIRQAEATAEVARRSAEAVTAAQQQLLSEIQHWNDAAPPQAASAPLQRLHETTADTFTGAFDSADQTPFPAAAQSSALAQPQARPALLAQPELQTVSEPIEPAVPLPANLIEFPRQLVAARRARARHAEGPLREEADASPERAQLRIFEVEAAAVSLEPAVSAALPEWHTIRLDAQASPRAAGLPDTQTSLSMPVFTAPLPLRVMAVTVDACCILSAFLVSVAVSAYASPELPGGLYAAGAAAGTLFLFGLMYYGLFFTLNDATPGMRYARIGLCTFSDENPTRSSMRRRVFAVLLAGLPLGLGWVWAAMDEDGLGWHDRISRMYPREY